jgi:uncharacterized protein (UPF0128 family)
MNKLLLTFTLFLTFTFNLGCSESLDSDQMVFIVETLEILNCEKEVEDVEIICIEKEIPEEVRLLEQQIMEQQQKAYLEHQRYMSRQKDERQVLRDKVKALNMEQLKIKNNQETGRARTLENQE